MEAFSSSSNSISSPASVPRPPSVLPARTALAPLTVPTFDEVVNETSYDPPLHDPRQLIPVSLSVARNYTLLTLGIVWAGLRWWSPKEAAREDWEARRRVVLEALEDDVRAATSDDERAGPAWWAAQVRLIDLSLNNPLADVSLNKVGVHPVLQDALSNLPPSATPGWFDKYAHYFWAPDGSYRFSAVPYGEPGYRDAAVVQERRRIMWERRAVWQCRPYERVLRPGEEVDVPPFGRLVAVDYWDVPRTFDDASERFHLTETCETVLVASVFPATFDYDLVPPRWTARPVAGFTEAFVLYLDPPNLEGPEWEAHAPVEFDLVVETFADAPRAPLLAPPNSLPAPPPDPYPLTATPYSPRVFRDGDIDGSWPPSGHRFKRVGVLKGGRRKVGDGWETVHDRYFIGRDGPEMTSTQYRTAKENRDMVLCEPGEYRWVFGDAGRWCWWWFPEGFAPRRDGGAFERVDPR